MFTNPRGYMRDPRLRGRFTNWLRQRSTAPRNVVGQDANRMRQAVNAVQGRQYTGGVGKTPLYSVGQRLQQAYRNRPQEQSGANKPSQPAAPPNALPTRRM